MLKAERRRKICDMVNRLDTMTTAHIAESLGVSEMTVRRDLGELSEQGLLVRVHGGARSLAGARGTVVPREATHREKASLHAHEKALVATAALEYLDEGSTVFLGTGTTLETMARLIPSMRLRVITNSLPIVNVLGNRAGIDLVAIGGSYRPSTEAFVGPIAEQTISTLGIDAAFVGLNGIWEGIASTSNTPEGMLQRLALERAGRRYLLGDSSKLGRRDFYGFWMLDDASSLITDRLVTDEQLEELERHTRVVRA